MGGELCMCCWSLSESNMPGIWLWTVKQPTFHIAKQARGDPWSGRDRRVCGCLLLGLFCNEMKKGDEILEDIARLRDWLAWLELGSMGTRVEVDQDVWSDPWASEFKERLRGQLFQSLRIPQWAVGILIESSQQCNCKLADPGELSQNWLRLLG